MLENRSKLWSSVDLHSSYQSYGGNPISRKTLFAQLQNYFGSDVVVLSSPGLSNILAFKNEAAKSLHLQHEDDDIGDALQRVAAAIERECLDAKEARTHYVLNIDKQQANKCVSDTLVELLCHVSKKLTDSLQATMIGNIVSSVVCSKPTYLNVALGVMMNRHKSIITDLSKFNVCCTYDEVLRFKHSAAVAVSKEYAEGLVFDPKDGLIHWSAENFDSELHSQNCKSVCH